MFHGWFDSSLIGNVLYIFEDMGLFDYALPWLLYFVIIYGLLSRVNIFGKEKGKNVERINRLLAITMATLIIYYAPQTRTITEFLSELFTKWGVLAVTLLLIPLTLSILGVKFGTDIVKQNNTLKYVIAGIITIVIFILFYETLGYMFRDFWIVIDPYTVAITITLVTIGFIIVSVTDIVGRESEE